jgi:hypothetical protein
MNSLYTSGVRQTNSLQADLERLRSGDTSPALLGTHVCQEGFTSLLIQLVQAKFLRRWLLCKGL